MGDHEPEHEAKQRMAVRFNRVVHAVATTAALSETRSRHADSGEIVFQHPRPSLPTVRVPVEHGCRALAGSLETLG